MPRPPAAQRPDGDRNARPRLLVLRFSSLGDVVLSMVLLDAIAATCPGAHVTFVTKSIYGRLFEDDPRVDDLRLIEPGDSLRKLAHELREREFDLVLDAHGSLRSRALTAMLAPSRTQRVAKDTFDRFLHLRWAVDRPSLHRRQIDRFLDLLPAAPRDLRPRILIDAPPDARLPTLGLAPGARHLAKEWPLERFAEVGAQWNRMHPGRVLLLGSESDLCARLGEWLSNEADLQVEDRSGRRDLRELATDLAGCDRLVCNDSGLLHLAEAVDTPVIALFGPTTRAWGYFPLHPRSRVVETELRCRPCSRNGSRDCALQHRLCMELLAPADVLDAMRASTS